MSNTDFFQIAAFKVFAELGQLIEEDEGKRLDSTAFREQSGGL